MQHEGERHRLANAMKHRPILGGVFGFGRYALASVPCTVHGLHAVRYFVVEPATGTVLSLADDKTAALDEARAALRASDLSQLQPGEQRELWPDEHPHIRPVVERRRPVSKRRREVFAKSQGRCHYCARTLTLDGAWHVEHQLPRALGGADEAHNLVAACAPCNLEKRDRTAIEFVAGRK